MNKQEAADIFEYDAWATNRVLDAAAKGGDDFLNLKSAGVGSIRDLIVHNADGQLMWLNRIKGEALPTDVLFKYDRFSNVDQVRDHAAKMNKDAAAYISGLSDADLNREVKYIVNPFGPGPEVETPVWQILTQIHSHGIHHRSEASELLSQKGNAPEETNFQHWFMGKFMAAKAQRGG